MTRLLGTGEGNTVVILTGEESQLLRSYLEQRSEAEAIFSLPGSPPIAPAVLKAFNRGIARGTERVKAEFDELQKRRKAAAVVDELQKKANK